MTVLKVLMYIALCVSCVMINYMCVINFSVCSRLGERVPTVICIISSGAISVLTGVLTIKVVYRKVVDYAKKNR